MWWLLVLRAYLKLIEFEATLVRGDFAELHHRTRNYKLSHENTAPCTVEQICSAVDMACIWYWKEVRCLQRSAVTTCLLKRFGVAAQLVIGVQQTPFKAHAWVEVEGNVVNDKVYVGQMYSVLEKF